MRRGSHLSRGAIVLVGLLVLGGDVGLLLGHDSAPIPASSFCECSCTVPRGELVQIGRFESAAIAYSHAVETPGGLASSAHPAAPKGWRECSGPLYEDADGQRCRTVESLTFVLLY